MLCKHIYFANNSKIRLTKQSLGLLVLMFGAVSKEGITADLEAMKRAGLGGTYLMPIKGIKEGPQYNGKAQQLTPEWWEMVRFSMEEADRLGLKLGMHICDGFALAGGPWMTRKNRCKR